MNFFLQGQSGIGKSTLLLEALNSHAHLIGGFMTQRLIKNGKTVGFRAVNIDGAFVPLEASYKKGLEGVFLLKGKINISSLEKVICQVEQDIENENIKLVFMDEIGGMELTSPIFTESLERIFLSKKPCIGVLKSRDNLTHTMSTLGLGQEYMMLHSAIEKGIISRGNLIMVTKSNLTDVQEVLSEFLSKSNLSKIDMKEKR